MQLNDKMKHVYQFDDDNYYQTFKAQLHNGPNFNGISQKGGGFLGALSSYAVPLFKRYIVPHAKQAALSLVNDVVSNRSSLQEAIKRHGYNLAQNIKNDLLCNQKGSGKRLKRKAKTILSSAVPPKKQKVKIQVKQKVKKSKKSKKSKKIRKKRRTKIDILS